MREGNKQQKKDEPSKWFYNYLFVSFFFYKKKETNERREDFLTLLSFVTEIINVVSASHNPTTYSLCNLLSFFTTIGKVETKTISSKHPQIENNGQK